MVCHFRGHPGKFLRLSRPLLTTGSSPASTAAEEGLSWSQMHALWMCSLKPPLGGKTLERGKQEGLGCQNILQAATCHLPTRNPALPLPVPPPLPPQLSLIKRNLVGTAGTSATVPCGKHPSQTKAFQSFPVEGRVSPRLQPHTALLAQFTWEPNALLLEALPHPLGESFPQGTHLREDLGPTGEMAGEK